MGGYRPDTNLLERRNRFRPAPLHAWTGRGANSGGRLAGEAIRGGIRAAAMTAAGKQARRRKTIKQKIVHGIQENGMNYRKTISSMIVRPAKREAGMGDRETIDRLIVRLVRREAGIGERETIGGGHDRAARSAGSRGGKRGEPKKLIYTMGTRAGIPKPIRRISRKSDSDVLLRCRRYGILR